MDNNYVISESIAAPGTISAFINQTELSITENQHIINKYAVSLSGKKEKKKFIATEPALSDFDKEHLKGKDIAFSQNLPFYTCINGFSDLWLKEYKSGELFLLKRTFDWSKDKSEEEILQKLR